MKDLKEFFKKYWLQILLIMLACLLLPIIIVHVLFKSYSGVDYFVAEWSAGELLQFIGAFLSFAGTIVLGVGALYASIKANDLSEKVIEIEQDRNRLELRPFVIVSDWNAYEITQEELLFNPEKKYISIGDYQNGTALGLEIELTNTTNSFVSVEYSGAMVIESSENWGNSAVNQSNRKLTLSSGQKDVFVFYATESFMKEQEAKKILIELILENRFSKRYKESFEIILTRLTNEVNSGNKGWYCSMLAQNYQLYRFEKDEVGNKITVKEDL